MKKILITGGDGDIAHAISELLISKGYEVLAPYINQMDVTKSDEVEEIIRNFKPQILINNAGIVVPNSIKNENLELTKKHIDVNLWGPFNCAIIGLKYNPNLEIINIGSAAAIESHATWSEYCATKAGIVMATKCWSEDGIYSVVISPGRTKTKMRKSLYPNEDQNTLLNPEDFAKVILLCVEKKIPSGTHLIVRKQNVEEILKRNFKNELL